MSAAPIRIPSEVASQGGCFMLFGAPFLALGAIVGVLVVPSNNAGPLLTAAIFMLFGGAIVAFGIWKLVQAAKFAPVFLELAEPARVGVDLVGRIEAKFSRPPARVSGVVACWLDTHVPRRGKGGGGMRSDLVHETKFEVLASDIGAPAPGRASAPIRVALPATCPPAGEGTDAQGRKTNVRWILEAHADLDGVDFYARFPFTPTA